MSTLGERAGRLGYGLMILCTVAMTVVVIRREFFPPRREARASSVPAPIAVKDWGQMIAAGHRFGPLNARVTIVEFSDFECPACRIWNLRTLPGILAKYPDDVAVLYRHWPLDMHRMAYPSARAAECAATQGRFKEFHRTLFEKQDQLGVRPFAEFAKESGVPNLRAFEKCNADTSRVATIEADLALAQSTGGKGTPTVAVDGVLFPIGLDSAQLDSLVQVRLRGGVR